MIGNVFVSLKEIYEMKEKIIRLLFIFFPQCVLTEKNLLLGLGPSATAVEIKTGVNKSQILL